jgi:tetratricopeptide (TPR) repeat protein
MAENKGFIKTESKPGQGINPGQKALLLRKGNELFNDGKLELAEKIFITLSYTDGIARVGDAYWKQGNYTKAVDLYRKAPDPARFERACKRMALIVRHLLKENNHARK